VVGLQQGWDIMQFASLSSDDDGFSFFVISKYNIDGGDFLNIGSYSVILFDDDTDHNNVYDYPNENDEFINFSNKVAGDELTLVYYDIAGEISNIPSSFVNPIILLVYPIAGSCWPGVSAVTSVSANGSYAFNMMSPASNYKLWIVSDVNNNGSYDSGEPYLEVPERAPKSFCEDNFIDLNQNKTINITLGVLSGNLISTVSSTYSKPKSALYQGWSIFDYDDTNFEFTAVKKYSINGVESTESYTILIFDDDNDNGTFQYGEELCDTSHTGYTPDNTSISINVP